MLNRYFGRETHTYLHVLGLTGIAFSLTFSKVVMSISMMFIVLNLLLESDFRGYWQRLKSHRLYHLLLGFILIHVIALLWSENLQFASHDLKAKLPLLVIPTILVARPIKARVYLHVILYLFLISLIWTSFFNYAQYQHWFGGRVYDDIRGMSLFGSHIRYALLISFGVGVCLYFAFTRKKAPILFGIIAVWLTYYTIYSQVISGVATLAGILFVFIIYHMWLTSRLWAYLFSAVCVGAAAVLAFWLFKPLTFDPGKYKNLPTHTAEGNPYSHQLGHVSSETGEPLLLYMCDEELEREWNKRSSIDYHDKDIKGNKVRHTLVRYLASKHLRRDAGGVKQLSQKDIENIEKGCASVNHSGLMARLHGIRFELNNSVSANGHSLLQRLIYWRTGMEIGQENWLVGVGTGDVQDKFDQKYEEQNSELTMKNRRRAHNMFITIFLTFGVIGLILFISLLFQFISFNLEHKQLLGLLFITVAIVSFLLEDTLEPQTGVTFFALFFGIFMTKIPSERINAPEFLQ